MTRALLVMLVAAACGGQTAPATSPAPTSQQEPGAPTAKAAVTTFMAAIKSQDLDQLAVIWGSKDGPARDVTPKDQLRQRELIIQCYFRHDSYTVTSDVESSAGMHTVQISVTWKDITRDTKMQVVTGPHGRWYVNNMDLAPLQPICAGQNPTK
ncbi:MAG TPA: hypothetical protein VMT93_06055 [Gemmatimonadaceae bacterium]|nr:hypothetical protein [Gemmatimonadaceae bacterium]